jgi:hypothetical protein
MDTDWSSLRLQIKSKFQNSTLTAVELNNSCYLLTLQFMIQMFSIFCAKYYKCTWVYVEIIQNQHQSHKPNKYLVFDKSLNNLRNVSTWEWH